MPILSIYCEVAVTRRTCFHGSYYYSSRGPRAQRWAGVYGINPNPPLSVFLSPSVMHLAIANKHNNQCLTWICRNRVNELRNLNKIVSRVKELWIWQQTVKVWRSSTWKRRGTWLKTQKSNYIVLILHSCDFYPKALKFWSNFVFSL